MATIGWLKPYALIPYEISDDQQVSFQFRYSVQVIHQPLLMGATGLVGIARRKSGITAKLT